MEQCYYCKKEIPEIDKENIVAISYWTFTLLTEKVGLCKECVKKMERHAVDYLIKGMGIDDKTEIENAEI